MLLHTLCYMGDGNDNKRCLQYMSMELLQSSNFQNQHYRHLCHFMYYNRYYFTAPHFLAIYKYMYLQFQCCPIKQWIESSIRMTDWPSPWHGSENYIIIILITKQLNNLNSWIAPTYRKKISIGIYLLLFCYPQSH